LLGEYLPKHEIYTKSLGIYNNSIFEVILCGQKALFWTQFGGISHLKALEMTSSSYNNVKVPASSGDEALQKLYEAATAKRKAPFLVKALQGWLAGAYLSFGGFLAGTVAGNYLALPGGEGAPTAQLLYSALFPLGLMFVVFGQGDLFTSNCMTVVVGYVKDMRKPASAHSDRYTSWDVFYVLLSSWVWNLAGSLCLVYFLGYHGQFFKNPTSGAALYCTATAKKKFSLSTSAVFLRGISANWLVCLAVFFAYGCKTSLEKAFLMWIPIICFVGIGLEHCIANMFSLPCGILTDTSQFSWGIFSDNVAIATLGNIFGGVFVGLVYLVLNHDLDEELSKLKLLPLSSSRSDESNSSTTVLEHGAVELNPILNERHS